MKALSKYGRVFNSESIYWSEDKKANFEFLKAIERHFNNVLKVRGNVFLNEVYDTLGFPRTSEGCIVGWLFRSNNEVGDNFIDFGLPKRKPNSMDIPLDFNVDGVIYDKLEEP